MKSIIVDAASKTLDQLSPTTPNMRDTVSEWFQTLEFTLIKKAVDNFELVETRTTIIFQGIVESITPQQIQMRPEGERKWGYINVWASAELVLSIDDVFRYQQVNYRVVSKNDWSAYGYVQYECAEDYRA